MYCTYLTTYSGNKLPPFYIGYSTVEKVNSGYMGSVTSRNYKDIWLKEKNERSNLFKTFIISVHSDIKEAQEKEKYLQRHFKVRMNPMYINKSIAGHADLRGRINITDGYKEKKILGTDKIPEGWWKGISYKHSENKSKTAPKKHNMTEEGLARRKILRSGENNSSKRPEVRAKIKKSVKEKWNRGEYDNIDRKYLKGESNPFFGKKHKEETNKINSEKHKGTTVAINSEGKFVRVTIEELRNNPALKGMHANTKLYNNGKISKKFREGEIIPTGWVRGKIK